MAHSMILVSQMTGGALWHKRDPEKALVCNRKVAAAVQINLSGRFSSSGLREETIFSVVVSSEKVGRCRAASPEVSRHDRRLRVKVWRCRRQQAGGRICCLSVAPQTNCIRTRPYRNTAFRRTPRFVADFSGYFADARFGDAIGMNLTC